VPELIGLPSYTQHEDTLPSAVAAADAFRTCINAKVPRHDKVCAVCARHLPLVTKNDGRTPTTQQWTQIAAADIPHKELLLAELPDDSHHPRPDVEAAPRHALTTVVIDDKTYCKEPAGFVNNQGRYTTYQQVSCALCCIRVFQYLTLPLLVDLGCGLKCSLPTTKYMMKCHLYSGIFTWDGQ
jgi:hypothetical protein